MQVAALACTSRFIPQLPFTVYKGLVAAFFVFWCVRWPVVDYTSIFLFVTYWTWYMGGICEWSSQYSSSVFCPRLSVLDVLIGLWSSA